MIDTPSVDALSLKDPYEVANKIYSLIGLCHGFAREHGWWTDLATGEPIQRNFGELIALCHSELSEGIRLQTDGKATMIEWTRVEDSLPPPDEEVLVWDGDCPWLAKLGYDEKRRAIDGHLNPIIDGITHWAIVEPPT